MIEKLKPGDNVTVDGTAFEINLVPYKNGMSMRCDLQDKDGLIGVVAWDNAEEYADIAKGSPVVSVTGTVNKYKGKLQLVVSGMKASPRPLADMLPQSERDIGEMVLRLKNLCRDRLSGSFASVAERFFESHWFKPFCEAPAGKKWHHAYIHGLLEHTLEVMQTTDYECKGRPLRRDLAILGALLHDIGKVREFSNRLDYTVEGRLIGHQVIGYEIASELIGSELEPEDRLQILHIVISHDDTEGCSPRVNHTTESAIVHLADMLSAKVNAMLREIKTAKETDPQAEFTGWIHPMDRFLYIGAKNTPEPKKTKETTDELPW